jgi:hypothetical protein
MWVATANIMRFRELRSILQRIVLAGLPATACTSHPRNMCGGDHFDEATIAEPADPALQMKIDSCRADSNACIDVCRAVGTQQHVGLAEITLCDVTFDSTHAYVAFEYGIVCLGRLTEGLVVPSRGRGATAVGAWLANAAWLEAASIPAFVRLARELVAHDAPRALIERAIGSAGDEARHAAIVGALARRHGARASAPELASQAPRALEALAIENAIEGCVRETYGAVLALWQSHTASDPAVRDAFATIARDEARHAELGWEIDAWARSRLDAASSRRVLSARAVAAHALLDAPGEPELPSLGLPDERTLRALRARTHAALWRGGLA